MMARTIALGCYGGAFTAIIFIGFTGARWPLSFAAILIVLGMIIGIGEILAKGGPR